MNSARLPVFHTVRARYLVIAWLLPFVPWVTAPLADVIDMLPWYWSSVAYSWLYHASLAAALLALCTVWRLPVRRCLGALPTHGQMAGGLQLTAWVFLASLALTYALFYPLSLVVPDVVQRWYIDTYLLLYFDFESGRYPLWPNVLQVVSLCVAAPVLEEVTFRGIILPRWSRKWGMTGGMLLSSALFALPHIDPIGAFVFGLAMCALYLKTQSLVLPIVCHAANNLLCWLIEAAYAATYGPESFYTLEEFQAGWPWGVGAAVIALAWLFVYLQRPKSETRWTLPVA